MMMLAFAELRAGWRSWTGAAIVVLATAVILGACATLVATWLSVRHNPQQTLGLSDVLLQLSIMVPAFSGMTAVALLSTVASVAVQADRSRYGRWQLLGVTPGQVRLVLLIQLGTLAIVFGVVGLALAASLAQPTIELVSRAVAAATGEIVVLRGAVHPLVLAIALGVIVLIVVLSGLTPARQAARSSVLDALRTPENPGRAMTKLRWLVLILLALATTALMLSTFGNSPEIISLNTIFACITASGAAAAATPKLLPGVIRMWPRLLPDRWSIGWTVARQLALQRVHTSAAAVAPLMIGITLIGSIFSAAYTERDAMLANSVPVQRMDLATDQIVIMLGGPLLLAVIGSAVIVFQDGLERGRTFALLSRLGFRRSDVLRTAAMESLVYVGTAVLLSAVIIVVIVACETIALTMAFGPFLPVVAVAPIATVSALGMLIIGAATMLPLVIRKSVA